MKLVICVCALLVVIHGAPADDGSTFSNVFNKITDNVSKAASVAAGNVVGCSSGIYKKKIGFSFSDHFNQGGLLGTVDTCYQQNKLKHCVGSSKLNKECRYTATAWGLFIGVPAVVVIVGIIVGVVVMKKKNSSSSA